MPGAHESKLYQGGANLIRSHGHDISRLPSPDHSWSLADLKDDYDDPPIGDGQLEKFANSGLITKVDRETYDDGTFYSIWRLTWQAHEALERAGYLDEHGNPTAGCGDDGLLPCGSPAFVNHGDVIKCKRCQQRYSKDEITS